VKGAYLDGGHLRLSRLRGLRLLAAAVSGGLDELVVVVLERVVADSEGRYDRSAEPRSRPV